MHGMVWCDRYGMHGKVWCGMNGTLKQVFLNILISLSSLSRLQAFPLLETLDIRSNLISGEWSLLLKHSYTSVCFARV